MTASRLTALVLAGAICHVATACRVDAQSPDAERTFSAEEQQARQKILDSEVWQNARRKFDQWLSVQVAYNATEVEAIKASLASHIERSSADDLTILLHNMQRRLDVLLSPEVVAARDWADSFYTAKGMQELAKKHGLDDPMRMSAMDLTAALAQFSTDRQSQATANSAFMKGQAAAVAGAKKYRQDQQAAAAAAASAPRQSATFGAPYAPIRDRPQRYQAPYNPLHYSVGPWGGVWVGH